MVTEELQETLHASSTRLGDDAPTYERERHGTHSPVVSLLVANRFVLISTLLILLVVGIVASIAIGSWWALAAALIVHALGTLVTVSVALRMTTETEHPSPEVAARLEDEGVGDPDALFTELVEEFSSSDGPRRRP